MIWIENIAWFSILILFSIGAFYWWYSFYKGAPFYPSSIKISLILLNYLKGKKNVNFLEIGAGDGRVAIFLAKKGFKVTAVEINPLLTLWMRLQKLLFGLKNLTIVRTDFMHFNVSEFNYLYTYLFPPIMQKLYPKLFTELAKKSVIISNTFGFKKREPNSKLGEKILIYEV